ncbi:hypothetical protein [Achromobacter piechaudii]|uniref:Uncharacterized protein n=1 Tax=Achromobacter piechaudii TaxID=72556 RepID=A0ABN7F149_9BURK|nr:hypothetical protein [Achromobacter piechaudii]CAB3704362.1 hypothetical protein LMG1873_02845 [Achromobacter piechaudii]
MEPTDFKKYVHPQGEGIYVTRPDGTVAQAGDTVVLKTVAGETVRALVVAMHSDNASAYVGRQQDANGDAVLDQVRFNFEHIFEVEPAP